MLRASATLVAVTTITAALSGCGLARNAYVTETRRCEGFEQTDVALSTRDLDYFRSWTDRDYAKLEARIAECDQAVIGKSRSWSADQRRSLLQDVRDAFEAEREARSAAARQREACRRSSQYTRYAAASLIRSVTAHKAQAEQLLEHEHEVAKVSGVRNLLNERTFGEQIVMYDKMLKDAWRDYRAVGGAAKTAAEIETLPNPCET